MRRRSSDGRPVAAPQDSHISLRRCVTLHARQ
jgi:hypothetical protein